MTTTVIIASSLIILFAYFLDIFSSKFRVPSAILLLGFGVVLKWLSTYVLFVELPDFSPVLPVLGTVGLILIVLEGSLELEVGKDKMSLIWKSLLGSTFSLLALALILAFAFSVFFGADFKLAMINVLPLCVISSAIAIPSVRHLQSNQKEFVTYESSFSDIVGVLLFNFFVFNTTISISSIGYFGLEIIVMVVLSIMATVGLAFLLKRLQFHIKFIPITLIIILLYAVAKYFHLPSLLFIMILGLTLGNVLKMQQFSVISRFDIVSLHTEVGKLKEIVIEGTFLIRVLFFILFGYLINIEDVLNRDTIWMSLMILGCIYVLRYVQLLWSGMPILPLLFVSPRGLITILLFLSITPEDKLNFINNSLIIQVILLSGVGMMLGLLFGDKKSQ